MVITIVLRIRTGVWRMTDLSIFSLVRHIAGVLDVVPPRDSLNAQEDIPHEGRQGGLFAFSLGIIAGGCAMVNKKFCFFAACTCFWAPFRKVDGQRLLLSTTTTKTTMTTTATTVSATEAGRIAQISRCPDMDASMLADHTRPS